MLAPLDRFGVSCWDETQIEPGQHRQEQISAALSAAHIAVLLVSPDFLAFNLVLQQELSALSSPGTFRMTAARIYSGARCWFCTRATSAQAVR